eukprot:692031_1
MSEWSPLKLPLAQSHLLEVLCEFKGVLFDACDATGTIERLYGVMEKDIQDFVKTRKHHTDKIHPYSAVANHVMARAHLLLQAAVPAHSGVPYSPLVARHSPSSARRRASQSGELVPPPTDDLTMSRSVSKVSDVSERAADAFLMGDLSGTSELSDASLRKSFRVWKSSYSFDESEEISPRSNQMKLVSSFLIGGCDPDLLRKSTSIRDSRCLFRCDGLDALSELLKCSPVGPSTNALLLDFGTQARSCWSERTSETGPYYMHNVEGCSPELVRKLQSSYSRFLSSVVDILSLSRGPVHHSTILHCIDAICIVYRQCDVKFLERTKVLSILRKLMSSCSQPPHVRKAARTCFRQLATICILWTGPDSDQSIDRVVRSFQSSIFDLLFEELHREMNFRDKRRSRSSRDDLKEFKEEKEEKSTNERIGDRVASTGIEAGVSDGVSDEASFELLMLVYLLRKSPAATEHLSRPGTISTLLSLLAGGTLRIQRLAIRLLQHIFTTTGIFIESATHTRRKIVRSVVSHIGELLVGTAPKHSACKRAQTSELSVVSEAENEEPLDGPLSEMKVGESSSDVQQFGLILYNSDPKQ